MATDPPLGTKIKRARERKRWTQQRLAQAIGVSQKTVDNWENGRTSPRSSIGAVEDVLGISLDGPAPEPALSPRLLDEIRQTLPDPADQERVIAEIEKALRGQSGASGQSPADAGPSARRAG